MTAKAPTTSPQPNANTSNSQIGKFDNWIAFADESAGKQVSNPASKDCQAEEDHCTQPARLALRDGQVGHNARGEAFVVDIRCRFTELPVQCFVVNHCVHYINSVPTRPAFVSVFRDRARHWSSRCRAEYRERAQLHHGTIRFDSKARQPCARAREEGSMRA